MSPGLVKFEIPAMTRRMILPDRVLGMSGTIQTFFGRATLPISRSIAAETFSSICLLGFSPGFSATYISTARPRSSSITGTAAASATSSTVRVADSSSLVPSRVDHVVDASEDPEVAVFGLQRPVAREIGPIVPVLTVLVLVVLLVVSRHEAGRIAVDRLEDARPGIADADVAGLCAPLRDGFSLLVEDDGEDSQNAGTAAARLHRLQGGQGAPKETAVLRLPPGIDDRGLALPDAVVVPAPDFRLDGFPDCGHVLEVVVVLLGFVGAQLAQHADGRGRRVEDIDP